ncbi:hypothetical protein HYX16_05495 [Candidatus Woesearchaeota archaeon]|nr:hypothetical protein [Candidatus Woesearchaeota archaeon]
MAHIFDKFKGKKVLIEELRDAPIGMVYHAGQVDSIGDGFILLKGYIFYSRQGYVQLDRYKEDMKAKKVNHLFGIDIKSVKTIENLVN